MAETQYVTVVGDPGCANMLPFGAYTELQWKAMKGRTREMLQILKYNQIGFLGAVLVHLFIHLIWSLATRIPGFNLYDGSEAFNANTHSGWWLTVDVLILAMGLLAPYFTLHYMRENDRELVETGVKRTAAWLLGYQIVAVLGVIMTGVHFFLSITELRECASSTLCNNYYWCQIALIVFLAILMLVLLWAAGLAGTYRANLQGAVVWGGLRPTICVTDINAPPAFSDSASDASAPPMNIVVTEGGTQTRLMTPLLQARLQQQSAPLGVGKFRHTPPAARTLVGMK